MTKACPLTVFNEVLTLPEGLIILLFFFFGPIAIPKAQTPITTSGVPPQLKTAIIYFVTPTGHNKVVVLKEELNRVADERQKTRIAEKIKKEEMEADSFSRALISAVKENFSVAEYDFIADTSVRSFVRSHEDQTKPVFLVRRSKTESGIDALILHDLHMLPLHRPVPYYAQLTGFTSFVDALFGKTAFNWKDLDKVIRKWSERLEEFNSR